MGGVGVWDGASSTGGRPNRTGSTANGGKSAAKGVNGTPAKAAKKAKVLNCPREERGMNIRQDQGQRIGHAIVTLGVKPPAAEPEIDPMLEFCILTSAT